MSTLLLSSTYPVTFNASDPVSTESEEFSGSGMIPAMSYKKPEEQHFSKNFRGII